MTHAVYKYEIRANTLLDLPIGAEVLTVQMQYKNVCMWVKVDINEDIDKERRNFVIVGTGHYLDDNFNHEYIGTVQEREGTLIWHVFEMFPKINKEMVTQVALGLDISNKEAKVILEEHKGNLQTVKEKFNITITFSEFQATREEDTIPFEVLGSSTPTNGYLYLSKQCAIIIIEDNKYELIIGNIDIVSNDLEHLEKKLYTWAMSEGFTNE